MTLPRLPLAWKLALVPAMTALLLVVGMLLLSGALLGNHLRERASAQVDQQAQHFAELLARALSRRSGELQLLARSRALAADASPTAMRAELDTIQARTPGYAWLGLTDLQGRVQAGSRGWLQQTSIADRPVFQHGQRGLWVGDVHPAVALAPLLARPGEPPPSLVDLGLPLRDADDQTYGVLAAHLDWRHFVALRDEVLGRRPGDGLRLLLLARDGRPLLGELPAASMDALAAAQRRAPGAARLRFDSDGAPQIAAVRAVPLPDGPLALGWSVVAVQDLDAALQPVTALQRGVIIGGLLLALGFGGVGYAMSRRLARPYAALLAALADRLAEPGAAAGGGLTRYLDALAEQARRLPPTPADEPGPLTPDALLGHLLSDAQRLRQVLDQLPAAVYLSDAQDRLVYWNDAAARMFGWDAGALGRVVGTLLRGEGRAPSPLQQRLAERMQAEPGPFDFRGRVRHRDGHAVWGEWRLSKMAGPDGRPLGLLALVRDATAEQAAIEEASRLQHWLQILTDAAIDYAFVVLDLDGRVRRFNSGAERLKGYRADQVVGQDYALFFTAQDRAAGVPQRLRDEARRDGRVEFEGWRVRRDGSRFWGNVLLYRLGDAADAVGYAEVARDLSARRAAETRAQQHEATLAAVIHAASDAIISTDVGGHVTLFNPAAERIFGRPAAALLGQPLEQLLPPAHRAHHGGDLARFAASRISRRSMGPGRVQGLHADGRLLELEASISQVTVGERQVLTAILRDVTERVAAERALAQYQDELTALTQQLMQQEKLTTRRLAQALHDQLGQTLAAIRLGLDAAPPPDPAQHARLDRLVEQAIAEVRQVLVDLRPPLLDEQGLAAALDNEIGARRPLPAGVELLLDVPASLAAQRWPGDVEYAAFMVAREAIGNALRHAGASLIRVALAGDAQRLELEVGDDGHGDVPEAAAGRPGHLGMVGMRERAAAIGARFEVRARPGEGTQVLLRWKDWSR